MTRRACNSAGVKEDDKFLSTHKIIGEYNAILVDNYGP